MKSILISLAIAIPVFFISCQEKEQPQQEEKKETPLTKKDYPAPPVESDPLVDYTKWEIRDGKFFLDGEWKFLKIGKPLYNFSNPSEVAQVKANLETYRQMHYNAIELNLYCHFFEKDGDGIPDVSLEPVSDLVEAIYNAGMYPCISVETYTVGGGCLPDAFFTKHPDALAVNDKGDVLADTEYGTGSRIVSIFSEDYNNYVHTFIKEVAKAIDTRHVLWFETTVEPQYMGSVPLCYSDNARNAYERWRTENKITDEASEMPEGFPIPPKFILNETWNKFRAQALAEWVNGDAEAWRSVAGKDAYVAVDYLDTGGKEMYLRNGDSEEFLRYLTCADIIQISGHWNNGKTYNSPYDKVYKIMAETNRDWVVAEHMTLNGQDFADAGVTRTSVEKLLENTLTRGTRMGWEFVNIRPNAEADRFCVYNSKFAAVGLMITVDTYWGWWMHMSQEKENAATSGK